MVTGGVGNLFSNATVDLASNAETQALRNFDKHKNLRIIYTISEVAYRMVADKRKIRTSQDLKDKKIGAINITSSGYFVDRFMASHHVHASRSEYTVVSGQACNIAPCGNRTYPALLKPGAVDATGFWEPTVELAARETGLENAIFFYDFEVYREIYNLHTTTEKLADPVRRKKIVEFVRALEKSLKIFREEPETLYKRVAEAVGGEEEMMMAVWDVHKWPGTVPEDLVKVLAQEDEYVARTDNRTRIPEEELKDLVDLSILEEVRRTAE
jgi:ABC-type nitrate/sulfonate/bicarbonate transport system substrate-binding protein